MKFKTPLYPLVPLLSFILNMIVIVSMAFIPDQRMALYCGIPFMLVCLLFYHFSKNKKAKQVEETNAKEIHSL